jgi:hypothetical protein
VLFAYRHTLELYLKIIGEIEDDTHSLRACILQVEKRHGEKFPQAIKDWILEFDSIDPIGTAFRYADDRMGTLSYAESWIDFAHLFREQEDCRRNDDADPANSHVTHSRSRSGSAIRLCRVPRKHIA